MGRGSRALVLAVLLGGVLVTASPAAAGARAPDDGGTVCAGGPCPMFFYAKGDGSGVIEIYDDLGQQPDCVVPPQCARNVQFAEGSDTPAVIRARPHAGYEFRGWEECPGTNEHGDCLVSFTDSINTQVVCAIFVRPGSAAPAAGCPPPAGGGGGADRVAPNTRIFGGPALTTRSRRAAFRFRATETASFVCKLDRRPWLPCRSPRIYAGLRIGWHTFRVKAIDRAGNIDPTPALRRWRVRA